MTVYPAGKYRLAKVPRDRINLRAVPSAGGVDLGDLYPGTFVELTGEALGDWVRVVTAGGVSGWVALQNGAVKFERVEAPAPAVYANGVDISQAQTPLDWNAVKAGGVNFAIIRATQGTATSRPVGLDTRFHAHIDAALAAGMRVGVYMNYLPDADGVKQAEFYYAHIAPYLDKLAFPPAVDVETVNGRSPRLITERLHALVRTLEPLIGMKPMLYTAPGWWDGYTLNTYDAYFTQCPLWLAHWHVDTPTLPRCWRDWRVWQTTNNGRVHGYAKRIDLDKAKV